MANNKLSKNKLNSYQGNLLTGCGESPGKIMQVFRNVLNLTSFIAQNCMQNINITLFRKEGDLSNTSELISLIRRIKCI